ncbi:DUF4113 domain-containing protein [Zwartia sp.]|jgi:DNA polymerase V|uniref:DUF4113 domain-containing protein n=2 Tax=Zwartia sp. TaxID=2978004 RepID=UPI003BB088F6
MAKKPRASTLMNFASAWNRLRETGVRHGWISPNAKIPKLTTIGIKSVARPAFSRAEIDQILAAMPAWTGQGRLAIEKITRPLLRDYVEMLLYTGMRHGTEALAIRWQHISWHMDKGVRYLRIWVDGKTGGRWLIAKHAAVAVLERLHARQSDIAGISFEQLLTSNCSQLVFRTSDLHQPARLDGAFKRLLKDVGLLRDTNGQVRTLYSLRHTYATLELLENGTDIHTLARQMVISMGQQMRERIKQWTGLPVCVGVGPTKTLAKFANHLAKKNAQFDGVCDLHSIPRPERIVWMSGIDVSEVWGVGSRISKRLEAMGIYTVLDLRNASPKEIRTHFGVVLERTCNELRGISCLELEDIAAPKKQIMSSRSFGTPVQSIYELRESIASHLASGAEKLRKQHSVCAAVYVFIQTNRFNNDKQYSAGITVPLSDATDDTSTMTRAALVGLDAIYRSGYKYKKAGAMLTLISDKQTRQMTIFDDQVSTQRSAQLMSAVDSINRDYGQGTIRSAVSGVAQRWAMRSENRSPRYTTSWDELPFVH